MTLRGRTETSTPRTRTGRGAVWHTGGELPEPSEALHVKFDRNFAELLQELRVALTGVQILFAFLLVLPFQARFTDLTSFDRHLYAVVMVTVVLTTVALLSPVAFHRMTFRRNVKNAVVRFAHTMALVGLFGLSLSVVSSLWLALRVAGVGSAPLVVGLVGATLLALWWVVPVWARLRCDHLQGGGEAA